MSDMKKSELPPGMTIADLARSLGVALSTVYHWGDEPPGPVRAYLRQLRLNRERREQKPEGACENE